MKRNQIEKTCKHCQKNYSVKASHAEKSSYCSRNCFAENRRIHPKNDPRPCVVCQTIFTPSRKHGVAKYCSKQCEWKALKGPDFNARIARETSEKRAAAIRRRGDVSGKWYRKVGGRHEHRVVAEAMLGRPLTRDEVVHHKDHNKRNNDPSNLEVLSRSEHMREHGIGIPGQKLWWKPWEKRGAK